MQQIEKLRSSSDQRYDEMLEGVELSIICAISANRQTPHQVLMRYMDHANPGESFHEWLGYEYPAVAIAVSSTVSVEGVRIPEYDYGEDVKRIFETSPRVDGLVDDDYLHSVGCIGIPK